ncbi:hypothetical protein BJP40_06555 [Streptomyces sp. CC53]|uniref:hypothetical protein n=1 Tax=Streptomyces sp. CC53 TaxID=1906740 RepID=UPI0008DC7DD3|nr:hypothetical protein [Streptomyces sp. CC53]OII61183.1 hypothetical protein BJP40_06555 [Streptomyces sp. CC53]
MTDLYPGSLTGYRHFHAAPDSETITSVSFRNHHWHAGDNTATCHRHHDPNLSTPDSIEQQAAATETELAHIYDLLLNRAALANSPLAYDQWLFRQAEHGRFETENRLGQLYRALESVSPHHRLAGCRCGFYASYDPATDFYNYRGGSITRQLHGVVEAWGTIILGTKGFRASTMRIKALAPASGWDDTPDKIRLLAGRVSKVLPSVHWYDTTNDMIADWPEPDRSGLPVTIDRTETGLGQNHYGGEEWAP